MEVKINQSLQLDSILSRKTMANTEEIISPAGNVGPLIWPAKGSNIEAGPKDAIRYVGYRSGHAGEGQGDGCLINYPQKSLCMIIIS